MCEKPSLSWFMVAIFVLALIAFSGQVSSYAATRTEPIRTELREESRMNPGKTAGWEIVCKQPLRTDQTKDFTARLLQYASEISVWTKRNRQDLPAKKFLVQIIETYCSNDPSDVEKG